MPARIHPMLLGSAFAGAFSVAAATVPPGGLGVTPSGNDLGLSFTAAAPRFYTLQSSTNLVQWTNYGTGLPGDGTLKSLTISNAFSGSQSFYRYLAQMPTRLTLSQNTAFAILGYDCGGIKETISAGFDTNGMPIGMVEMSTSCGGSGRDGGGHTTTHTASAVVSWDFSGNVVSVTAGGTLGSPLTGGDGLGDVIYGAGASAYLIVPVPPAPAMVSAVQTGDQFDVSWTPNGGNPTAVTSSTLTATLLNSTAPVLTTTVAGSATSGVITMLQPQTTYQITVANATIGGTSQPSTPVNVTTSPATVAPSAPAGVAASWSNPDPSGPTDSLIAAWQAADPGNSPVDQYLVTITGSDGGGTFSQTVSGTTLTTYFNVDYTPNWSVTVQAHNAAGWGPVSKAVQLGGL